MRQSDAIMHVNAYRLGTVPPRSNAETTWRPQLEGPIGHFLQQIAQGSCETIAFRGTYGSGKSHALTQLRRHLQLKGYVVAHICLDTGFNLSQPELLYYQFMHHLYAPFEAETHNSLGNTPSSFEDLFALWIDNLRSAPDKNIAANDLNWVMDSMLRYNETFALSFLEYIRASLVHDTERAQSIAAWLKGDPNLNAIAKRNLGLKGQVNRIMAFDFMQAFLHLLKLMGYPGCILLIDELDLLRHQRSDRRELAYASLRQLIDLQQSGEFGVFSMVLAGTPELFSDDQAGISSYAPLAQRLNLNPRGSYQHAPIADLTPPSLDELYHLAGHLMTTYQTAYSVSHMPSSLNACHLVLMDFKKQGMQLHQISLRTFVQNYIGFMDEVKKNPNQKLLQLKLKLSVDLKGEMTFTSTL